MNLNEYMVAVDRPLGLRFALAVDGRVFVHSLKRGVKLHACTSAPNAIVSAAHFTYCTLFFSLELPLICATVTTLHKYFCLLCRFCVTDIS
jgi:hypothetical protein